MGFKIEINSILRSDEFPVLKAGATYQFEKSGSRVFFDDIPIWLARMDWTALAEIQVISQKRVSGNVSGEFRVLHIYEADEQELLTGVFVRMYAGPLPP
jgi:hypothetical protein